MCRTDFCQDKTHRCNTCIERRTSPATNACKKCSIGVKCNYKQGPPKQDVYEHDDYSW